MMAILNLVDFNIQDYTCCYEVCTSYPTSIIIRVMVVLGTKMEEPTTSCNRSWMGVLHSIAEDMAAEIDDGNGERRRM